MRSFREYLLEAIKYDNMFDSALKAISTDNEDDIKEIKKSIDDAIKHARATFENKNDRVVWFLRLWRVGLVDQLFRRNLLPEKFVATVLNPLAQRMQCTQSDLRRYGEEVSKNSFATRMRHFLSLPIQDIKRYVFQYQTPDKIFADFEEAEKRWQETVKTTFVPEPEDKKLITFPNGFAWWLLERGSCSVEGEAMGHCGNAPSELPGDRILSLRQSFMHGGIERVKPYLTFILHEDGYLGEMKGRFNASPKNAFAQGYSPSNFHNEIVALLKHDIVKGIRGGGYAPHENFSLTDLDDETAEALIAEKPELADFSYWSEKYLALHAQHSKATRNNRGYDDTALKKARAQVLEKTRKYLLDNDLAPAKWEVKDDVVVLNAWNTLSDFCHDIGDETLEQLLNLLEELDSKTELADDDVQTVLSDLSDDARQKLVQRVNKSYGYERIPYASATNWNFWEMIASLCEEDSVAKVVHSLYNNIRSDLENKLRSRIDEYIDKGWPFIVHKCSLHVPHGGEHYAVNKRVELVIDIFDLIEMVRDHFEDREGGETENHLARFGGYNDYTWESLDKSVALEDLRGNLVDDDGKDRVFGDTENVLTIVANNYEKVIDDAISESRKAQGMRQFMNIVRF